MNFGNFEMKKILTFTAGLALTAAASAMDLQLICIGSGSSMQEETTDTEVRDKRNNTRCATRPSNWRGSFTQTTSSTTAKPASRACCISSSFEG